MICNQTANHISRMLPSSYSLKLCRRAKGFTLIEVVVALTILSIIMLLLYTSVNRIFFTIQLHNETIDETLMIEALLDRMEQELQTAYVKTDSKTTYFISETIDQRFSLLFTSLAGAWNDGVVLLLYEITPSNNASYDIFWGMSAHPQNDRQTIKRFLWQDKIKAFHMRFWDGVQWTVSWNTNQKPGLPMGIAIELTTLKGTVFKRSILLPTGGVL